MKLVRDFMCETLGLSFYNGQGKVFEKRVAERIEELKLADIYNYYLALKHRYKEIELINLIEKLNISETYFYREEEKLNAFKDYIFPELINGKSTNDNLIHIWSAGCSTGEEPFTLAMMLKEKLEDINPSKIPNVRIMATDINEISLSRARKGAYDDWSMRHLPKYYIDKYTTKKNGTYEVTEDLKKMVEFLPLNLNNIDLWIKKRGFTFDVIFCRNVLMYFSADRAKAVIEGFYKILDDDGVLLVASTESASRHSDLFKIKKVENSFVYTKANI